MHVGGSIALEVRHVYGLRVVQKCFVFVFFLPLTADGDVFTQVKRQAENRLKEHFSEPLRVQAHAMAEDDDAREPERRIPQPL